MHGFFPQNHPAQLLPITARCVDKLYAAGHIDRKRWSQKSLATHYSSQAALIGDKGEQFVDYEPPTEQDIALFEVIVRDRFTSTKKLEQL